MKAAKQASHPQSTAKPKAHAGEDATRNAQVATPSTQSKNRENKEKKTAMTGTSLLGDKTTEMDGAAGISLSVQDNNISTTDSKKKKKKKKKTKGEKQTDASTEPDTHAPETSKANEIDDIFEDAIDKIASQVKEKKATQSATKRTGPASAEDEFFDSRGLLNKKRKRVDGVFVYDLDELGVGRGGGTADCPFDCKCCY